MSTVIKPSLSRKNKYHINRHRYYELKHYCLQYHSWKKQYQRLDRELQIFVPNLCNNPVQTFNIADKTAELAIEKAELDRNIKLIETVAAASDPDIGGYILKAVTEGHSFNQMKMIHEIPCERDMFYDRYRKFFWLLNMARK